MVGYMFKFIFNTYGEVNERKVDKMDISTSAK